MSSKRGVNGDTIGDLGAIGDLKAIGDLGQIGDLPVSTERHRVIDDLGISEFDPSYRSSQLRDSTDLPEALWNVLNKRSNKYPKGLSVIWADKNKHGSFRSRGYEPLKTSLFQMSAEDLAVMQLEHNENGFIEKEGLILLARDARYDDVEAAEQAKRNANTHRAATEDKLFAKEYSKFWGSGGHPNQSGITRQSVN